MSFLETLTTKYLIVSASDTAYWTCFAYDGIPPTDKHCTHKYFGEQPEINVKQILDILDMHFEESPYTAIAPVFDKEEFFGEEKDTRVLTKDNDKYPNELFLPELKYLLDLFRNDNFPEYKPHVTTDDQIVDKPLTRYCLMQGDKVVKEY